MFASRLGFAVVYGVILLLPFSLLLFGTYKSRKRSVNAQSTDTEPEELHLARWVSVPVSLAPLVQFVLSELSARTLQNLLPYLNLAVPLFSIVIALVALILFFLYARGIERFTSPVACLLTLCSTVLSCFAGFAVA